MGVTLVKEKIATRFFVGLMGSEAPHIKDLSISIKKQMFLYFGLLLLSTFHAAALVESTNIYQQLYIIANAIFTTIVLVKLFTPTPKKMLMRSQSVINLKGYGC